MKQTEKFDLILKKLYEFGFDGKYHSIVEILSDSSVQVTKGEVYALIERLDSEGLVKMISTKDSIDAIITSYGVQYCEDDSFTHRGIALINNNYDIKIENSPGANIVNRSTNVNITNQINEVRNILGKIRQAIDEDIAVSDNTKAEIIECILEIDNNLKAGQVPKFGIRNLIELAGDISSIAGLVITLIQLLNK